MFVSATFGLHPECPKSTLLTLKTYAKCREEYLEFILHKIGIVYFLQSCTTNKSYVISQGNYHTECLYFLQMTKWTSTYRKDAGVAKQTFFLLITATIWASKFGKIFFRVIGALTCFRGFIFRLTRYLYMVLGLTKWKHLSFTVPSAAARQDTYSVL